MSTHDLQKKLRKVIDEQQALLAQLLDSSPILRGSFSRIHTRCGKPNCWCAQAGKGHVHARITWSQNGQLVTRKVPKEFLDRVRKLTASYRQFRQRQRRLIQLAAVLKATLSSYGTALEARTRSTLPSFVVTAASTAQNRGERRPKARRQH